MRLRNLLAIGLLSLLAAFILIVTDAIGHLRHGFAQLHSKSGQPEAPATSKLRSGGKDDDQAMAVRKKVFEATLAEFEMKAKVAQQLPIDVLQNAPETVSNEGQRRTRCLGAQGGDREPRACGFRRKGAGGVEQAAANDYALDNLRGAEGHRRFS